MIEPLLLIVLIAGLGTVGSKYVYSHFNLPLGLKNVLFYGTEYIFIGLFLGPYFLNVLTPVRIDQLYPLTSLGLGWIGLVFGSQLELRRLKRFPANYYFIMFFQSLFVFAVLFIAFYILISYSQIEAKRTYLIAASMAIAASGAITNHPAVFSEGKKRIKSGKTLQLMRFVSSLDDLFAFIVLGILFSFFHVRASLEELNIPGWQILVFSIALSFSLGFLLRTMIKLGKNNEEKLLITLGVVIFSSGLAGYFHLSPLFITFMTGLFVSNSSPERDHVHKILIKFEKPVYIIFLILAGSMWKAGNNNTYFWIALFSLTYIVLRVLSKYVGNLLAINLTCLPSHYSRSMGLGMISQGGLALVLTVNYHEVYRSDISDIVLAVVVIAVFFNELAGPLAVRFALRKNR